MALRTGERLVLAILRRDEIYWEMEGSAVVAQTAIAAAAAPALARCKRAHLFLAPD